ncbi:MAG: hypothetical protein J1F13_07200 [Prevotellaceae bacterium]|nr:hypothetical protein [Prevotellaceae bacterium]
MKTQNNKLKLRNWLNIVFMVLAVGTIIIYFAMPMPERRIPLFAMGSLAVMVKMVEVMIRITYKNDKRRTYITREPRQ